MRFTRKFLVVGSVVAALGAIGASSASADLLHQLTVTGTYTGQLQPNSGLIVEYDCAAASVGATASVNITRCGVQQNHSLALPFNAATIAGVETLPLAPFSLCFAATATYVDGSTVSKSGCTAPQPLGLDKFAGAGAA